MTDHLTKFHDFLRSLGWTPDRELIVDDRKHRFKAPDQKKPDCEYCLKTTDIGLIGYAKNYKTGEFHKFIARDEKQFTPEERAAFKKRMDAERKARDRKLKEDRDSAAKKAKWIWDKAQKGTAEYLTRKGIDGQGAKIWRDMVVVPAWKDGQLVSLQFIKPDGSKRFLKDSDLTGAYGSIGRATDRIYICEGFATSKSVAKATEGAACIWAFNASNLLPVAESIRGKYKDAEIIICADNDQWTEINGQKVNVGIEKGHEAAAAVKGLIIWPEFPHDDQAKRTDFNDLEKSEGLDKLRDRLRAATPVRGRAIIPHDPQSLNVMPISSDLGPPPSYLNEAPPPELEQRHEMTDWRQGLICNDEGKLVKGSLKNALLFIDNHDTFEGLFKYNEFSHQIMVSRCPVWEPASKFQAHVLNDMDLTETAACLERYGLSTDRNRVHNAIEVVAHRNSFHPAKDYFNGLEWDGVRRLDSWLKKYLGAVGDSDEYLAFIGKKWLTAAVKRVFNPACKFDHILVMEGKQGAGKSTALKVLATFGDDIEESYFTDAITIADIQNKDTIAKIQGSIIVELAELAGFNKKDDEEIKRWITLQHDDVRLPYARTPTRFNRQFVLSATTNSYDYLKDPTGNRRYWPFKAGKINLDQIKSDRQQLWAEAVALFKSGMYIGPTPDEMKLATSAQDKRRSVDVWEDDLLKVIEGLPFAGTGGFKTKDVMKEFGLGIKDMDFRNARRITNILQMNGYSNEIRRVNGKSERVWIKDVVANDVDGEEIAF